MSLSWASQRPQATRGSLAGTAAAARARPSMAARCAQHPQQEQPDLAKQPSRRDVLAALPAAAALPHLLAPLAAQAKPAGSAGDWSSPGLAAPEDEAAPRFLKLDGGVKVQVLSEGSGPEAQLGDRVLVDYVLRRSNGYFIYGTLEGVSFQPRDVPVGPVALQLGDGSVIPGLEAALLGMRPGGKRRALIPPELGYLAGPGLKPGMPTFATQRQLENHKSEPLLFEYQVLRVGEARG